MNQQKTRGIILRRVAYGEADRIITVLTDDVGKLALIAKGVRKQKSKMAGGIDLFSVSELAYVKGRGNIGTLVSSRLQQHYAGITKDINRTMLGYELIKLLDTVTEDETEVEYFDLLEAAFIALDDATISMDLIRAWFTAQLLRLTGSNPNLHTDVHKQAFDAGATYDFDVEAMVFTPVDGGMFAGNHIKLLRLVFSDTPLNVIQKVQGLEDWLPEIARVILLMKQNQLGVE